MLSYPCAAVPSLILLDCRMPGGQGCRFSRRTLVGWGGANPAPQPLSRLRGGGVRVTRRVCSLLGNAPYPEVHRSSSEVRLSSSEVRLSSSEVRLSSSELHRSSSEVHRSSSEVHRSSSELHRSSSEVHRSSSEVHRSSSELHRSRWGAGVATVILR